ncbi:MAG: hypothetical protein F9K19_06615 [Rhizobiaceae bacterium]|nr:MAG: hypothetical protein F9K19_06615 [Rhizobiaceae bacterium]CAG1005174.1 hypothetical protein RHIZO_03151 [Rhizobiaceae bacterium]
MEWKQAWQEERAALMRLVALLNAFAGLAERAAGRSAFVRGIVLWILRRAEAIAREFVTGEEDLPHHAAPPSAAPDPTGNTAGNRPEDALRLAETFRALAFELEAQIALLCTPGDGRSGRTEGSFSTRRAATMSAALSAFVSRAGPLRVAAPDTS